MRDITTFKKPENRWLSNMTYVDITYDGITYPSTENFYQAMKYDRKSTISLDFGNDDENRFLKFTVGEFHNIRKYISYLKPQESKKFSKENPMTSRTFEENKLEIMLYAQRKKYMQEPFKSQLLATGDCLIEEGNWWGDQFWGVDLETRKGYNHLGKIIMQVRQELRDGII